MVHRILILAVACSPVLLALGCGSDDAGKTPQAIPDTGSSSTAVANGSTENKPAATSGSDVVASETPAPDPKPTQPSSIRLFDGKTFAGWEGNLDIFRIEDGAIVGGTLTEKVAHNDFLTTKAEFADFELRLRFMLKGENTNAGVQIRSRRIDSPPHEMIGYQADLGQSYWGCLYDESRRRKVLTGPDKEELEKVLKRDGWNDYRIRCEGRRIQLWINGFQTVDYTEDDETIEQTGLIGLQIHGGPPGEAWYRDIELQQLNP